MADIIKRITAHLDQPLSETDQEIFGFVKQHFFDSIQNEKHYSPAKVEIRNSTVCVISVEPEKWKKNYERRQEILHRGFFTPVEKSYLCIGILHLDNQDLFSSCLSAEDQELLKSLLEKRQGKKAGSQGIATKSSQDKIRKDVKEPSSMGQVQQRNGFCHIKLYLEELKWIHTVILTGQPLLLCLRELSVNPLIFKERTAINTLPLSEPRELSGGILIPLSETREASKSQKQRFSMSLQAGAKDAKEEEELKRKFILKCEHHAEKLQVIFMIMCGITNMKSRDLRIMTPLSADYVKILMKGIQTEKSILPAGSSQQPNVHLPPNVRKYRMSVTLGQDDLHNMIPDVTWETFIHEDTLYPLNSDQRCFSCRLPGSGRPLTLGSKKSKMGSKEATAEYGDLPPWFALILDEKVSLQLPKQKPKDKTDVVIKQKHEFKEQQQSLGNITHTRIAEKRQNRTARMQAQVQYLNPKTGGGLHSVLLSLKKGAKALEPTTTTSFWFTALKNESLELVGEKHEEINNLLKQLEYFQSFTAQTLPYGKEKLCLLTLSLPAHKLLRTAVQHALIFIVENILQSSSKELKHWYQYRKLPFTALI